MVQSPITPSQLHQHNADSATITDDDGGPAETIMNIGTLPTIAEGSSILIPVTLNQGVSTEVTVDFAVTAGTATLTNDYTVVTSPNTLTFNANDQLENIEISIVDDIYYEADEQFTVALSNASAGVTIGTAASTGVAVTIPNDDPAPGFSPLQKLYQSMRMPHQILQSICGNSNPWFWSCCISSIYLY